jgi:hypothetical protein
MSFELLVGGAEVSVNLVPSGNELERVIETKVEAKKNEVSMA